MREKTLLKIAAFLAVAGLMILYLASLYTGPTRRAPSEISAALLGEVVETCGKITGVSISQEATFFRIAELRAVFFGAPPAALREGISACVVGEVALYKQNIELVARKINAA